MRKPPRRLAHHRPHLVHLRGQPPKPRPRLLVTRLHIPVNCPSQLQLQSQAAWVPLEAGRIRSNLQTKASNSARPHHSLLPCRTDSTRASKPTSDPHLRTLILVQQKRTRPIPLWVHGEPEAAYGDLTRSEQHQYGDKRANEITRHVCAFCMHGVVFLSSASNIRKGIAILYFVVSLQSRCMHGLYRSLKFLL